MATCQPAFPAVQSSPGTVSYTHLSVVYTSEENDQRNKYFTAIQTYIQSTKAEFIIGTQDIDANWDTFLQTLDSMGLQELLAIEQAAYDRYAVNLK